MAPALMARAVLPARRGGVVRPARRAAFPGVRVLDPQQFVGQQVAEAAWISQMAVAVKARPSRPPSSIHCWTVICALASSCRSRLRDRRCSRSSAPVRYRPGGCRGPRSGCCSSSSSRARGRRGQASCLRQAARNAGRSAPSSSARSVSVCGGGSSRRAAAAPSIRCSRRDRRPQSCPLRRPPACRS